MKFPKNSVNRGGKASMRHLSNRWRRPPRRPRVDYWAQHPVAEVGYLGSAADELSAMIKRYVDAGLG